MVEKVVGYCVKCKKKVEIKDGKTSKMKTGSYILKGKCGSCKTTTVCRILGKEKPTTVKKK